MKGALSAIILACSLLSFQVSFSQNTLSPRSSISLLTCGSGADLYSIFGHTAIRVKDTTNRIDVVFNYGTFQFSDDFYVKFVMGKLNYRLSTQKFESFEKGYRWENRWVEEQVLNLNYEERKQVFEFLRTNYLPENREYLYDFFYDNCSTRPRDVFETVLGDRLIYNFPIPEQDSTFKDMLNLYLENMKWEDAGMDLGLGMPAEHKLSEHQKLFLPIYLLRAYDEAVLERNGASEPFVMSKVRIVDAIPYKTKFKWFNNPALVFIAMLLLWIIVGQFAILKRLFKVLDPILFFVVGLAGFLILFLWFVTDHTTTQINFDVLWASPIFLILFWIPWLKTVPVWIKRLLIFQSSIMILLIISFVILPQELNTAYIPLILLLISRTVYYSGFKRKDFRPVEA